MGRRENCFRLPFPPVSPGGASDSAVKTAQRTPAGRRNTRIAVLVVDGVSLSSLNIFRDIIALANALMAERDFLLNDEEAKPLPRPMPVRLSLTTRSIDGAPVRSADGTTVEVEGAIADAVQIGLLFVPSGAQLRAPGFDDIPIRERGLAAMIAKIWQDGAIVAGAGTAVAILARSGILDGRAATIGWHMQEAFRRRFPAVRLDGLRQITEDTDIFCASSLMAEIVLGFELLSRITSTWVGEMVRRLTTSLPSEPDAPAFAAIAETTSNTDMVVAKAIFWIAGNYSQPMRMADLAASLSISERTLLRRFQQVTRMTPHAYARKLRLDVAARMLRGTNTPISHVAAHVGYGDVDFFKQLFKRHYGAAPSTYRRSSADRRQALSRAADT